MVLWFEWSSQVKSKQYLKYIKSKVIFQPYEFRHFAKWENADQILRLLFRPANLDH